ncbi:hypothetical protein B4U79_18188 [Dinothrombium tinctorium]|uniref:Uncharacterized protein n=1 Tax=Dinothrombium tinctorium TaxID=1965070 RepID=A0A3S4QUN4_9ACAR|nr:hypothetical protein B4U79_18188 [Dinothrombium tinctorium]
MKMWLTLLLCLLSQARLISSESCPGKSVFFPCQCEYSSSEVGLICKKVDGQIIETVFNEVSKLKNVYKNFDFFQISNASVLKLSENILGDLKFASIFIFDSNITQLDRNALKSSHKEVEELILQQISFIGWLRDGNYLFEILKQFENLRKLSITNTNLKSIPENAFLRFNATQEKLFWINLSHNKIQNVGDFAFYELTNLQTIDLSYNRIKHISKDTFAFWKNNSLEIKIDLSNNFLSTKCFEFAAFSNAKRNMFLNLAFNNITHLEESIFASILRDSSNRIVVNNNPFVCNCKNAWIIKDRKRVERSLLGLYCEDGNAIFERNVNDYHYCSLKNVDIEDNICGCSTLKMVHFLWKIVALAVK